MESIMNNRRLSPTLLILKILFKGCLADHYMHYNYTRTDHSTLRLFIFRTKKDNYSRNLLDRI